jgi:hypothetical protein
MQPPGAMVVAQNMLVHFPIALTVTLACWLLGRGLGVASAQAIWLGWFAGAVVWIMREVTQHEYRWIATTGKGLRAHMPALEGLKFWNWNAHSLLETLGALGLSALVALAIARWT